MLSRQADCVSVVLYYLVPMESRTRAFLAAGDSCCQYILRIYQALGRNHAELGSLLLPER